MTHPSALVEVLSHCTEIYDRELTFDHVRRIPSLQEYLLVSHRERLIEGYH